MKRRPVLVLAILLLTVSLVGCSITPGPSTPNDNFQYPDLPEPPDEFAPPIDDDDYDVVIGGGDTGETNPPEENPPEENPPEDNPPVDNPPVENPPVDNPPEDNPPEDNPPEDNPPVDNPPEDNPPVVDPPVVDPSLGDVPASSQVANGFVVKQKKYDHGSNNLIVLNVTNNNSENYIVTITGYYLDANGNVLKTETQTVNGYVANYEKYFSFIPEIAFDKFVFTLTAEKYSGECLDHLFSVKDLYIRAEKWGFSATDVRACLALRGHIVGSLDPKYIAKTTYVVIGSNGTVYKILSVSHGNLNNLDVSGAQLAELNQCPASQGDGWVPELKDGYSIITTHTIVLKNG